MRVGSKVLKVAGINGTINVRVTSVLRKDAGHLRDGA